MSDVNKGYNRKIIEGLLGLLFLTLPISITLNSICLIVLFVISMISRLKSNSWKSITIYWPCLLLFIIQIFGYLQSEDVVEANKKLLLFTAFFTFSFIPLRKIKAEGIKIFNYLIIGVLIIALYAFSRAIWDVLILNVRFDYGYGPDLLLKYLPHHAYFSLFVLSSILAIAKQVGSGKWKLTSLLLIPILYLILFTIPSRTNLILSITILPVFTFYFLSARFAWKRLLLIGCTGLLSLLAIGMSIDFTRDKIIYTYYDLVDKDTSQKPFYGVSTRQMIWRSSIELIKEADFFGTGIGDFQKELNQQYEKRGYHQAIGKNAHNQYLQNLIQYGILLTLFYFAAIGWVAWKLVSQRQWFLLSQWSLVLSLFLTESIMNRQWGVIFVAMLLTLSCLQLAKYPRNKDKSR